MSNSSVTEGQGDSIVNNCIWMVLWKKIWTLTTQAPCLLLNVVVGSLDVSTSSAVITVWYNFTRRDRLVAIMDCVDRFYWKPANIKFHGNMFIGSRADTYGQTGMPNLIGGISRLWERAWKFTKLNLKFCGVNVINFNDCSATIFA